MEKELELFKDIVNDSDKLDVKIGEHVFTIESLSYGDYIKLGDLSKDPIELLVHSIKKIDGKVYDANFLRTLISKLSINNVSVLLKAIDDIYKREDGIAESVKKN